jgi:hypothetical protein
MPFGDFVPFMFSTSTSIDNGHIEKFLFADVIIAGKKTIKTEIIFVIN